MAVLLNKTTGKAEKDPNAPPQSGVGSSALGAGVGMTPAAAPAGSGFTNIQKYIAANKGAGEKLAGRIGQDVERSEGAVKKAVDDTGAVGNQIQAEKDRIAQASGFAQQVNTDPTQLLGNLDAFSQLRTGQTAAGQIQQAGQTAFDTAQSKLNTLNEQAKMAGTEGGRFQMLQQALGRPTYNKGQQRLDQLLVQSGGGGVLGKLQQDSAAAAQAAKGTLGTAQTGFTKGLGEVGTLATDAQKLIKDTLGGLGAQADDPNTPDVDESKGAGAFGNLQAALQKRASDFTTDQGKLLSEIQSGVSDTDAQKAYADLQKEKQNADNGNWLQQRFAQEKAAHPEIADSFLMDQVVNPAYKNYREALDARLSSTPDPGINAHADEFSERALKMLGLQAGQQLYDTNLSKYIQASFNPNLVNEQAVAKDADLQRYKALNALAGTTGTYLQPGQIDTAQGVQLSTGTLLDDLAKAKQTYSGVPQQLDQTYQSLSTNPYSNSDTGAGWGAQVFTPGASQAQVAQNIQNLYNQYGEGLYGGRTDSLNAYHKQLVDWANQYQNPTSQPIGRTVRQRGV